MISLVGLFFFNLEVIDIVLNQLTFSGLICLNFKHVFLHILFAYYLLVHVCVCVFGLKFSHMHVGAHRSQKRVLDPLELQLPV